MQSFMAVHPRSRPFHESQKKKSLGHPQSHTASVAEKLENFWEGWTRGSMSACQARTDGQTSKEGKQTNSDKVAATFFHAFVPFLPISSVLVAHFFFPHKKISFKRWRNSPRLQCAHLLWCLFIIFLAALLDWHSSLEHLTTALYSWTSHYPLNTHMLNPPMGKPSLFLHSRRVKNLWQSILRHK